MSANEMTLDPAFDFNADLPDVSNLHVAMQTLACADNSWHMELPQGDIVYGTEAGVWPDSDMKDQPAARLVMQLSTKGKGTVVMDNSERIAQLLVKSARANGDTTASVPGSNARLTGSGDDDCAVSGPGKSGSPGVTGLLAALGAIALLRRRARRA
jgi:MYXO-CTERM domain-containing protein